MGLRVKTFVAIPSTLREWTKWIADAFRSARLESFTVATLPDASNTGELIYVSNEAGGAVIAFSDGTNWRRCTDRAVVS